MIFKLRLSEKTPSALYAFGIAGYASVAALPPLLGLEQSRTVSIPYRAAFLGLSIVVFITFSFKRRLLVRGPFPALLLIFWLFYVLRIILDTTLAPVPLSRPTAEYFYFALGVTAIPSLAFLAVLDDSALHRALHSTIWLLVLASLSNLYALGDTLVLQDIRRLGTETLNPISLAHLGVSLVLLSSFLLIQTQRLSLKLIAGAGMAILLGLFCVAAGASRGPVLALLAGFAALGWQTFRAKKRIGFAVYAAGIIGASIFVTRLVEQAGGVLMQRLSTAATLADVTVQLRLEAWSRAWHNFLENPVFGSGLELGPPLQYPHSVILEAFMATGILGSTFFLTILWLAFRAGRAIALHRPEAGWITVLMVQYVVGALLSGTIYSSSVMWMMLTACIATASGGAAWTQHRAHAPTVSWMHHTLR